MEQKKFITGDIWLASAITIIRALFPEYLVQNHKTLFVFPDDDKTYRAISEYNGGIALNIYDFVQTVKKLKAEMITRRQSNNGVKPW